MLSYKIKHFSLLYGNLNPASHNIFMETKEVWDRPGMKCACVSALGRHGIYKFPVCVDYSVFPYGKFMTTGQVSG